MNTDIKPAALADVFLMDILIFFRTKKPAIF